MRLVPEAQGLGPPYYHLLLHWLGDMGKLNWVEGLVDMQGLSLSGAVNLLLELA